MRNFKCFIIAVLAFRGTFYVNSFEEFDKQINFSSKMLIMKSALLPAKEFMTLFLSLSHTHNTHTHTHTIYTLNEHHLLATTPGLMGHEKGGNKIKMHISLLSFLSV